METEMENDDEINIEEKVVKLKKYKIDPVGRAFYGEKFTAYQKIAEIVDLVPAFKDFYYEAKMKDPKRSVGSICREFNDVVTEPLGRIFHPYNSQVRIWRRKWDLDLMQQNEDKDLVIVEKKNIRQLIKTKDENRNIMLGVTGDEELEAGVKTLGGELLNDAMQMLQDDQALEEIYDDDTLVKRRNYILNVFGHVTKLVHGKAALMLKASEEKRNNASFLMTMLASATAGKMTNDQLDMLKSGYNKKPDEQIHV